MSASPSRLLTDDYCGPAHRSTRAQSFDDDRHVPAQARAGCEGRALGLCGVLDACGARVGVGALRGVETQEVFRGATQDGLGRSPQGPCPTRAPRATRRPISRRQPGGGASLTSENAGYRLARLRLSQRSPRMRAPTAASAAAHIPRRREPRDVTSIGRRRLRSAPRPRAPHAGVRSPASMRGWRPARRCAPAATSAGQSRYRAQQAEDRRLGEIARTRLRFSRVRAKVMPSNEAGAAERAVGGDRRQHRGVGRGLLLRRECAARKQRSADLVAIHRVQR